jgi:hypothetical protein
MISTIGYSTYVDNEAADYYSGPTPRRQPRATDHDADG